MPVSKKRKKDGKPARRSLPPAEPGAEQTHGPEPKAAALLPQRMGRPTNPFVSQQQQRRGAQRGR